MSLASVVEAIETIRLNNEDRSSKADALLYELMRSVQDEKNRTNERFDALVERIEKARVALKSDAGETDRDLVVILEGKA